MEDLLVQFNNDASVAVSYTHLDVYKRQVLDTIVQDLERSAPFTVQSLFPLCFV